MTETSPTPDPSPLGPFGRPDVGHRRSAHHHPPHRAAPHVLHRRGNGRPMSPSVPGPGLADPLDRGADRGVTMTDTYGAPSGALPEPNQPPPLRSGAGCRIGRQRTGRRPDCRTAGRPVPGSPQGGGRHHRGVRGVGLGGVVLEHYWGSDGAVTSVTQHDPVHHRGAAHTRHRQAQPQLNAPLDAFIGLKSSGPRPPRTSSCRIPPAHSGVSSTRPGRSSSSRSSTPAATTSARSSAKSSVRRRRCSGRPQPTSSSRWSTPTQPHLGHRRPAGPDHDRAAERPVGPLPDRDTPSARRHLGGLRRRRSP